ncbi:hypothetical protein UFOVP995_27 [uncultured Caudovirales phage]|jgi:hypothetical protein|uniref:Uncharacterized protein n=1 Tax=uncultured Caudovirales phage TaxID=2100421 RepID=A0A6J5PZ80_9CAUD|nr:hypothetical protein UFOVP995_27 [uncultured Caudovirales phage]
MAYKQVFNPRLVSDDPSHPVFSQLSETGGELKIEFGSDTFVVLDRKDIRSLRIFLSTLVGQMPLLDDRITPNRTPATSRSNYALEA